MAAPGPSPAVAAARAAAAALAPPPLKLCWAGVASPRPGLPASDRDRDPPAPLHRDPSIPTVTDSCRVWGWEGPGGPGAPSPLCGRRNLTPVQGEAAEDGGPRAGADVNQRRPSSD